MKKLKPLTDAVANRFKLAMFRLSELWPTDCFACMYARFMLFGFVLGVASAVAVYSIAKGL
jgi:hypothetical protein